MSCYIQLYMLYTFRVFVYPYHGQLYTSASDTDFSLLRLVTIEVVYVYERDTSSWKAVSNTFRMDLRTFSLKSWPMNTYSSGFRQLLRKARLVAIGTPIVITWSNVSLQWIAV